jgi:hypothetical protein
MAFARSDVTSAAPLEEQEAEWRRISGNAPSTENEEVELEEAGATAESEPEATSDSSAPENENESGEDAALDREDKEDEEESGPRLRVFRGEEPKSIGPPPKRCEVLTLEVSVDQLAQITSLVQRLKQFTGMKNDADIILEALRRWCDGARQETKDASKPASERKDGDDTGC